MRAVAERHAVRDYVILDAREAADEGVSADAARIAAPRSRRRG